MAFTQKQPHFVVFPFMAQGHIIPMADTARLLAHRGITVTILLTPSNARKLQTMIDRAVASGLSIRVSLLKFPDVEAGLPEGCKNYDMLRSMRDVEKFFHAASMLKEQVRNLLIDLEPSCLIADLWFPWATDLALDLKIPYLVFLGMSCFSQVLWHFLETSEDAASNDMDYIVVPDLPDRIQMTRMQIRGAPNENIEGMKKIRAAMKDAEMKAFGIVANTFEELEPEYIKQYSAQIMGRKVWCVGPVTLCNEDVLLHKTKRGNKAAIEEKDECLKWLDLQKPGSVVYICLGSLSGVTSSQLIELGLALEASNYPFVWVLGNASDEFKTWLKEENFEERLKTRLVGAGLLIHGWAPQVLILSHPSIGGFLTHCGWNSTLEGIVAGLPMVTWPVFGDQFCNENFVVNVIKIGVRVGLEIAILTEEEEIAAGVQVRREKIKMAVDEMMDGGDEAEERRERARKLSQIAKRAMRNGEGGGSSYHNTTRLIQDVAKAFRQ